MMNSYIAAQIVEPNWLARPSTEVSPDLIGCTLVRQFSDGSLLRATIVETEAYGFDDPACHAYRRRTQRNEVMFGPAGYTYVYLIYGLYYCLNIVTDRDEVASAVLIRALQLDSVPSWVNLPTRSKPYRIAAGPGKLCNVMQIDRSLNGQVLALGQPLWLEHRPPEFVPDLIQTTRIGLTQGADLPWRWYLNNCPAVSKL
ncbi:MAG TPA: DNA-3-methyladenine glycosylase [Candidatus Sericytochromatia bacterium]|jgi:DNA-3-methyladenine glycosylase